MYEKRNYSLIGIIVLLSLAAALYIFYQFSSVTSSFPVNKNFTVNESESLKSVSDRLQGEGYIRSALLFRVGVSFLGKDRALQIGGYSFSQPLTLFGVINSFVRKGPTSPLLSVTVPEGSTSLEIATIITKAIPEITVEGFLRQVMINSAEGKLFPSTYFLLPSYREDDIIKLMLVTFTKKVASEVIPQTIPEPLTSEKDILVLASILEGEAKTEEDMKIVAGILLARLQKGMLLQVDVAKETYKQKGLPRTPLNNPGVVAIRAALNPTPTEYFYYITGKDGKMYYAKTFEEHKRNISKYLR